MKFTVAAILGVAALLATESASATPIVLTFEGIGNQNPVGNYYNGGAGGSLGVTFSSNALAIVNTQNGGGGNFAGNPSGDTILFFLSGSAATLNDANGFKTGFSFYYSAINNPGSVNVYSGLNGTGTLLASLALPTTPSNPPSQFPNEVFDPFVALGVGFSGTAKSIAFGGVENQIGFDNITFGSTTPINIPEVPSILLLLTGLLGLGGVAIRRV